MPTRIYAATGNIGKLAELRQLFGERGIEVASYAGYGDVEESALTYAGNAILKAEALHARLRADGVVASVVGDDSGLEIAALDGRPGVFSARYGGPGLSWDERRGMLRGELEATGSTDRSARFVCALAYVAPEGRVTVVERDFAGAIAPIDRGNAGFSYDPLFVDPATNSTFAELDEHEKNRISHRGRAVAALLAILTGDGE